MNKLQELKQLKEECVNEILNNPDLRKLEKLEKISDNGLWGYDDCISDIFNKWDKECEQEEERLAISNGETRHISSVADCALIEYYDRYQIINYAALIINLEYENEDDENSDKILVSVCRGPYGAKIYKTLEEIEDYIYDYAVKNKSMGFKLDWHNEWNL